ncbi:hypothetical protein KR093_001594, partial [Drosophila rubida]
LKMQACNGGGYGLKLFVLCLFLGLLLQSNCARVIYFKDESNNQSVASNGSSKSEVEVGMLLAVQRTHCRHGYMHDHRNRCRRVS